VRPARRVLLREVALARVDRDSLVADLGDLRELEARIRLDRCHVGRREALDEVELARLEVREAHRRVDDRQVDNLVEMDLALVPVIGVTLEDDPVLGDALDEFEWPRAY